MGIVKTSTLLWPIFVIPIYPFYGLALLEVRAGKGSDPSRRNSKFKFKLLERALRALAISSGGAVCPGGTRGQPRGSTPGVRGSFQGDLSEKKFCDGRKMDGRTDVTGEIVI